MDTPEKLSQVGWMQLAEMPEQKREEALVTRLSRLAELPEKQRRIDLGTMVFITGKLPAEKAAAFTLSRLRAWLMMDRPKAEVVAESYEAVMATMPAGIAWRRITAVRQALKNLSPEEQDKLHLLFPQEVPKEGPAPLSPLFQEPEPGKKSWWPWSKKGGANAR